MATVGRVGGKGKGRHDASCEHIRIGVQVGRARARPGAKGSVSYEVAPAAAAKAWSTGGVSVYGALVVPGAAVRRDVAQPIEDAV